MVEPEPGCSDKGNGLSNIKGGVIITSIYIATRVQQSCFVRIRSVSFLLLLKIDSFIVRGICGERMTCQGPRIGFQQIVPFIQIDISTRTGESNQPLHDLCGAWTVIWLLSPACLDETPYIVVKGCFSRACWPLAFHHRCHDWIITCKFVKGMFPREYLSCRQTSH
jgi:hypothetical protein